MTARIPLVVVSGVTQQLPVGDTITSSTTGSAATLTTPRAIDGQGFDGSSAITVIAPGTHAATSKTTPVEADELSLIDSAASYVLKKLTWANLKATFIATANTWLANQTFTGYQLIGGNRKADGIVFLDEGSSGTAAQTIDYSAGGHQKITVTGAFTLNAVTNWPASGNLGELLLELVNGASSAITWPTVNWVKSDGTTTTTFSSNGVTLQSAGTDFILLWTRDAGTTVYGKVMR